MREARHTRKRDRSTERNDEFLQYYIMNARKRMKESLYSTLVFL
jgi:hypothetical protein